MKTVSIFNSWVTCPQPNPQAQLRLFCFHYAGGGALSFRTWLNSFSPDIEVCPIELPGRGFRILETPFNHLDPLIQSLVQARNRSFPPLKKPGKVGTHRLIAMSIN